MGTVHRQIFTPNKYSAFCAIAFRNSYHIRASLIEGDFIPSLNRSQFYNLLFFLNNLFQALGVFLGLEGYQILPRWRCK